MGIIGQGKDFKYRSSSDIHACTAAFCPCEIIDILPIFFNFKSIGFPASSKATSFTDFDSLLIRTFLYSRKRCPRSNKTSFSMQSNRYSITKGSPFFENKSGYNLSIKKYCHSLPPLFHIGI